MPQIACLNLVKKDKGRLPTYTIQEKEWSTLSGTDVPKEVTIVISNNERMVFSVKPYEYDSKRGSGVIQKSFCELVPVDADDDGYYYDGRDVDAYDECYVGGNPPGGGGPPSAPAGPQQYSKRFPCGDSDRVSNDNNDRVSFRRFTNIDRWRDANEWFDGEHEMQVLITYANSNGGPTTVRKSWFGRSDDLRTCRWFSCDVDNFDGAFKDVKTWLEDVQGDHMNYTWLEVDDGNPIKLAFKFAPTVKIFGVELKTFEWGVETTISNKSDRLGEHLVEYCDSTTPASEYDTDWIIFQVDQIPQ